MITLEQIRGNLNAYSPASNSHAEVKAVLDMFVHTTGTPTG